MEMYSAQISRIRKKLELARQTDKDLKVFGANTHGYLLGPVTSPDDIIRFESRYSISLPDCYKEFLLHIGNGSPSGTGSAAGPFYGIYPLGKHLGLTSKPEFYLKEPVTIAPEMSDSEWQQLTNRLNCEDDLSDEDFELETGKLYSGLLPLGTQGCSCEHVLVLNGKHAGRVVNLDTEYHKPRFCFERNYLDWYERWLDEIISGILLADGPQWFGYTMGGNDNELLDIFDTTSGTEQKIEALHGLSKLLSVSPESCQRLRKIGLDEKGQCGRLATQLLTKFSYPHALEVLDKLLTGDDADSLAACQALFWYAKEHAAEWTDKLAMRLKSVSTEEEFRLITYIFQSAETDYSQILLPFCMHESENIRSQAYNSLGHLKNKGALIDQFIIGLSDKSPAVVLSTLQALSGITDKSLLPSYMAILGRFRTDERYILSNLEHRLKEMGFRDRADFISQNSFLASVTAGLKHRLLEMMPRKGR